MTRAVILGAAPAVAARLVADGWVVGNAIDDAAIDVLVIDCTVTEPDIRFRDLTEGDVRRSLDAGLYAFVDAVQRVLTSMRPGGSIVQIVSRAHLGAWGGVQIAATAAAGVAMARSMAIEFASIDIRVNSVAVGPEDADVAGVVAWLVGSDSGAVSGETILADRGASLNLTQSARR